VSKDVPHSLYIDFAWIIHSHTYQPTQIPYPRLEQDIKIAPRGSRLNVCKHDNNLALWAKKSAAVTRRAVDGRLMNNWARAWWGGELPCCCQRPGIITRVKSARPTNLAHRRADEARTPRSPAPIQTNKQHTRRIYSGGRGVTSLVSSRQSARRQIFSLGILTRRNTPTPEEFRAAHGGGWVGGWLLHPAGYF
jgi:hypothetical protein